MAKSGKSFTRFDNRYFNKKAYIKTKKKRIKHTSDTKTFLFAPEELSKDARIQIDETTEG